MKKGFKSFSALMVTMLLAALFVGTALAQGPVGNGDGVPNEQGSGWGRSGAYGRGGYGFVDQDGDGVNDRAPADHEFVDEDGDGVCDLVPGQAWQGRDGEYGQEFGRGSGGRGYGFVDEDGDGLNDRAPFDHEFVDEDGDGLCDEQGSALRQGGGRGRAQRN